MSLQHSLSDNPPPYTFQGRYCSVWPYLRGHFDRDFLHNLWALIEVENDWKFLFWDSVLPSNTPIEQNGDLVEFIHYFENFLDPKSILIVQDNETKKIAGLIWFNRMRTESAFGSIWISREFRGLLSREAVKLGMEYGFYARGWKQLFAITPWAIARNLLKRCGWSLLADVPEIFGPKQVYMLSMKEQDYHG